MPGTALVDSANRETAQLVSVAILELRMKLNRIADCELKALCDAMLPDDEALAARPQDPKSPQRLRRRPLLQAGQIGPRGRLRRSDPAPDRDGGTRTGLRDAVSC